MTDTETIVQLRELHDRLININQTLPNAEKLDDRTIDSLGQILTDLVHLYDQLHGIDAQLEGETQEVVESLRRRIETFHAQHPGVQEFLAGVWTVFEALTTQSRISQVADRVNGD